MNENTQKVVLKGGPHNGNLEVAPAKDQFLKIEDEFYGPYDGFSEALPWKPSPDGSEEVTSSV